MSVWQGGILSGRRARIGAAKSVPSRQAFSPFPRRSHPHGRGAFSGRSDAARTPFSRLDDRNGARGRTFDIFCEAEQRGRRRGADSRQRTPRCREILPLTGGDGGDAGDAGDAGDVRRPAPLTGGDGGDAGDAGDVRRPAPLTGGDAGDVDDVNDGTSRRGLSQRAAVRE